jgi:hypothetical protein
MPDPDYKALCAELLADYEQNRFRVELAAEARAALAQPEPVAPTDEEIMELMPQQMRRDLAAAARAMAWVNEHDSTCAAGAMRIILNRHAVGHARAALAKYGSTTPQSVPVSERLPGPEDCDKQGHVWAWRVYRPQDDDDGDFWMQIPAKWLSHIPFSSSWSHWLPAHALPTPEATNG